MFKHKQIFLGVAIAISMSLFFINCSNPSKKTSDPSKKTDSTQVTTKEAETAPAAPSPIDPATHNKLVAALANGDATGRWPVKNQPNPLPGSILPYKRIVAYYGNLYSKKMGILGLLPPKEMLAKMDTEIKKWEKADPKTPVQI